MKASAVSSTATPSPGSPGSCAAPPPERFALAGPSQRPDPRVHAYRSDVADIQLADRVFAPHYARAEVFACRTEAAMLRASPSPRAPAVSQLLHGERFAVLDIAGGWAWGRCVHDDYVGYLPADAIGHAPAPTHRVVAPLAPVFDTADIKAPVLAAWPIGSLLAGEPAGAFLRTEAGFVHLRHLGLADVHEADPLAAALRLLGQPYLWGGRGGGGIDCSGLVQVVLGACGIDAPRDSDQQRTLGIALDEHQPLARGDIVGFAGHVGIMADGERLLHANAHWMAVTLEPLADVLARFADPDAAILARRRLHP